MSAALFTVAYFTNARSPSKCSASVRALLVRPQRVLQLLEVDRAAVVLVQQAKQPPHAALVVLRVAFGREFLAHGFQLLEVDVAAAVLVHHVERALPLRFFFLRPGLAQRGADVLL